MSFGFNSNSCLYILQPNQSSSKDASNGDGRKSLATVQKIKDSVVSPPASLIEPVPEVNVIDIEIDAQMALAWLSECVCQCVRCDQIFSCKTRMLAREAARSHARNHCFPVKMVHRVRCPMASCSSSFKSDYDLQIHISKIHSPATFNRFYPKG